MPALELHSHCYTIIHAYLCPTKNLFPLTLTGTKETAFIHAVMAAGLVQAVTRSCSAGNMTECGCDTSLQGTGSPSEGWHWGGCSDHIQYGTWFSRKFIDNSVKNMSSARGGDALLTMNQHNSEAGRQVRRDTHRPNPHTQSLRAKNTYRACTTHRQCTE